MVYKGSKARIALDLFRSIFDYLPDNLDLKKTLYIEPFVGGLNMIQHAPFKTRIGYDSNEYLIAMWQELQKGWKPEPVTREFYYAVKDNKPNYPKYVVGWVGFICSFSGVFFGGYVQEGLIERKNPRNGYYEANNDRNIMRNNVWRQLPFVKSVELKHKFYFDINPKALNNCVIYCDPPYAGSSGYKDYFDSNHFWKWVRKVAKNNYVFVSEYKAPKDFKGIYKASIPMGLNATEGKHVHKVERLFVYEKGLR